MLNPVILGDRVNPDVSDTSERANSIWIRVRVDVEIFDSAEKVADSKIFRYVWTGPYFTNYKRKTRQKTAHVFIIILKRRNKIFFIARLQKVNPGESGCLENELVNTGSMF